MTQRTIYFKTRTPEHVTDIVTKAGEIAKAHSVGTAADDLLDAIVSGKLSVQPAHTQPLDPNPRLTLAQTLERSAAALQDVDPLLAEELRKRLWLIRAALQ
jgi:hypothetical protein